MKPMKFCMDLKNIVVREYDKRIERNVIEGRLPEAIPGKELEDIFNAALIRMFERIEEEETR